MNRRLFSKNILWSSAFFLGSWTTATAKKQIIPKRLKKGDTIGVLTPGSFLSDDGLQKAVRNIESLGFKVKLSKNIRAKRGFTAGTDQQRLDDLHAMFADDQVAGIWCARGGYGCGRLLPFLNYKLIRQHPKALIGYSDVTALLHAIYIKTGLIGYHGPVGASDFTDYTVEQFQKVLMERNATLTIRPSEENLEKEEAIYHPKVIRAGKANGKLIGGNLSLLAALAGTPYGFCAKDKIVFIEDIGEKPYRIDRMLTQLRQSSQLDKAAGIVLGVFEDCQASENDLSLSLAETLQDRLGGLNIPVITGLSFGHIANQATLPIGIEAAIDTNAKTIILRDFTTL